MATPDELVSAGGEEGEEDKGEGTSTASTTGPDHEVTSEVISSGTPSNVYNPKDSDSIVPMHLMGSYNGSLEGEEVGGEGPLDRSTSVISEGDIRIVSPASVDGVNNTAVANELKGSGKVGGKSSSSDHLSGDSDTRVLL